MPEVVGLILAGGRAQRMGGGDKCLRPFAGRPLLNRVVERLAPQCSRLILSANGDPGRFAACGLPVLADPVPGFAGPLAGILAGLDRLATEAGEAAQLVSAAADTPFLPPDLVARLEAARRKESTELACAASGGRLHPVFALWPVDLRADVRRALVEAGERKLARFIGRRSTAVVDWPTEPLDPFFNVNTPEDLAAAEVLAAKIGGGA